MTKNNPVKKIALSLNDTSGITIALKEYAALNEGPMGSELYSEQLMQWADQLKWSWAYGEDD